MNNTFVYRFLRNALWIIACITAVALFATNFIFTVDVSYNTWEQVTLHNHLLPSLLMLLVTALLIFGASLTKGITEKVSEKMLFGIFVALYLAMGIYLIINAEKTLAADPRYVRSAAMNLLRGKYDAFESGGYMHCYPHQLGLMLYDSLLALISRSTIVNFFANLLFVLGINYHLYKISDVLFKNRAVNLLTILVSLAFLPQLLFILFAYGLIPGLFFMVLAFYNGLQLAKEHKLRHLIGLVLSSICAILLKNNFMIGIIAIIIYLLLKFCNKEFHWKSAVAVVMLVLSLFLPQKILVATYENITGGDLHNGTPAILWVAMGTDLDNRMRTCGWYDGSNLKLYKKADNDKEIAQYFGEEKMKENIAKMQENPAEAIAFFTEKNIAQWCEPMFQSAFVAVPDHTDALETSYPELMRSIYTAGVADDVITYIAKYIVLLVYGFAAVFFIFFRNKCSGWEPFITATIGGFIFHTFWEGKSQYIFPYFIILIPIAMYALWQTILKLKEWKAKRHR